MKAVIIDIDSLRADRLGVYGYDRETSPTIDSVASEGAVFEQCYTSDSPCLPSRTALATARFGIKNGVVSHWGDGQWLSLYSTAGNGNDYPSDRPLSFKWLSNRGVNTSTITSFGKRHAAYHFTGSFRESIQPTPGGSDNGAVVTNAATRWIEDHAKEDDWLLHLNYWDVHHPYLDIDEYVDPVQSSGSGADWVDEEVLDEQAGATGVRCRTLWPSPSQDDIGDQEYIEYGDWPMPTEFDTPEKVQHLNDGYDASIRKTDAEVRTLLSVLEESGIRDETAIIITSDHGEAMGEHGIYAEHGLAHPPCQQVPLIIQVPDGAYDAETRVPDPVYQFDLVPTLCDLFDVDIPPGWDGETLTPAMVGEEFDGREYLVCSHGIYTFSRAVYRGKWMYARIKHPGVFSVPGLYNDPGLPGGGTELLHDLESDPHMRENLIGQRPDVTAEMRGCLDEWKTRHTDSADARGRDPLAEMATTDGPYLYVDPDELAEEYRKPRYSEPQRAVVESAAREFSAGGSAD